MNVSAWTPKSAWLPLTPRGVAAFASARPGRLLLVQFLFALIAAAVFGWFLHTAWVPTIREAIAHLPEHGRIAGGVLEWSGNSPTVLAEGHFLALTVDLDHSGQNAPPSHVRVEFGKRDWQVASLLGVLHLPGLLDTDYPRGYVIAFNRSGVGAWWGAWEPFLIVLAMAGLVLYLMLSWTLLATLYWVPAWLVSFYTNRAVGWGGSWRVAGAALMPGALFLSAAIVLYGLRAFDLVKLGFAFGMHFFVGWLYVFVSPLFLPRSPEVPQAGANPFSSAE